jgi:uncharacterized protein YwgA/O-acetyl-ADP-ribose deacetylase (regulator of RNase III)
MIRVKVGDIFESKAQTLVNTVNCVGIMGKGIALGFKNRYDDMYRDYVKRCKVGEVRLGQPYLFRRTVPPWILNFPTKDHWRSISRLEDIIKGLDYLIDHYEEWQITSIAVPPLGCGQGELEWAIVGPTLYDYLSKLDIDVELYAPYGTPKEELEVHYLERLPFELDIRLLHPDSKYMRGSWVALISILKRIENERYHRHRLIGRTSFQKIAYFATEVGIPTGLKYQKRSFGPFAPELKRIITRLANHKIIHEEKLGRMFKIKVGPTYSSAAEAYKDNLDKWSDKLDKIADLFMRMDTKQAELAATVHFACMTLKERNKTRLTEEDVLSEVMKWKKRRRPPLEETEVALTTRNLNMLSWLDIEASKDLPLPKDELMEY